MLFDPIASGGMATVFYGAVLGAGGFARVVAVKKMHEPFALAPGFVAMFLDEARLSARVQHPNVVSIVDVIAEQGQLYLVMECVDGLTLQQLGEAAGPLPPDVASALIGDALRGLHAAHEATDGEGRPLHIVHRDVSPQNILVGFDGAGRLLDFGIAKARDRLQQTRDGEFKGKIAYAAPEQVRQGAATVQSDLFSLAVVLWEALAGRRLFAGATSVETLYQVLALEVEPPSRYRPELPDSVDAVVLRGLSADPAGRFDSALAFEQALRQALPAAGPERVRRWVDEHAGALQAGRLAARREAERLAARLAADPDAALPAPGQPPAPDPGAGATRAGGRPAASGEGSTRVGPLAVDAQTQTSLSLPRDLPAGAPPAAALSPASWRLAAGGLALAALGLGAWSLASRGRASVDEVRAAASAPVAPATAAASGAREAAAAPGAASGVASAAGASGAGAAAPAGVASGPAVAAPGGAGGSAGAAAGAPAVGGRGEAGRPAGAAGRTGRRPGAGVDDLLGRQ